MLRRLVDADNNSLSCRGPWSRPESNRIPGVLEIDLRTESGGQNDIGSRRLPLSVG
jgi:hypothetical protein